MGIVTTWDNRDKTTVRMEFESEWTVQDLEGAIQATDTYISSVAHQVDVIVDIEGANLPKDFMNLAKGLLENPQPRANEGNRVVVGAGSVVKSAYNTIQKVFGEKIVNREVLFAANLPEARGMLKQRRNA
jgi:hypothetical protein